MRNVDIIKKTAFITAASIVGILLIITTFTATEYIKDCLFVLAGIGAFYLLEKKYPLPVWVVALTLIPFCLHVTGVVLNFFSYTLFGIGYDKYLHFYSSLIVTVASFYIMLSGNPRRIAGKIFIAILIAQGFGEINEINEFVGTHYMGFEGPTMFSQGDSLPKIKHDFVVYDTWWDMIFNLFGSIVGALLILIARFHQKDATIY